MADLTRARAVIGFEPKWKFANGLLEFLQWAVTFESDKTGYEQSLEEMRERQLLHGG